MNFLLDLAIVAGLAALLLWLRWTVEAVNNPPAPPVQSPLDFELIKERSRAVHESANRDDVLRLLGPPSTIDEFWEMQMQTWMRRVEESNREFGIPRDHAWSVWTNPKDGTQGVAVLFAGRKVYFVGRSF